MPQYVLDIVEIVGCLLQEQPTGDAFVPAPGMVIPRPIGDVVPSLHVLHFADLPAVDNGLGLAYRQRRAQRKGNHRLGRGRFSSSVQGPQLLHSDRYRLFEKQRDIPAQHLHGIRGMGIAPRADHAPVQFLVVQHFPCIRIKADAVGRQAGMAQPPPHRRQIRIRHRCNFDIHPQLQQHVLNQIAQSAAEADYADFPHTLTPL